MVKKCHLVVRKTYKSNKIKLWITEQGQKKEVAPNIKSDDSLSYDIQTTNQTIKGVVYQHHPLLTPFWWYPLLLPICIFQNYLMPYERIGVNDFFARIEFEAELRSPQSEIVFELTQTQANHAISKTFYYNLRKDAYLVPTVKPRFYQIEVVMCEGASIKTRKSSPFDRKYLRRWRIVRSVPAVITYGFLAAVLLYTTVRWCLVHKFVNSLCCLIGAGVIIGILVNILYRIKNRKFI